MKVVVFGGSGFIGSHVADVLTEAGYNVRIFDLNPSPYLKPSQKMVVGNVLNDEEVDKAVEGCDYIYHFAGITDLDDATTKSSVTIIQNIKGTATLLEAARRAKVKRFIFASTIYVYSDKGGFYRCSKQASELYIEEYQRRFGLDYSILRYGTVYGPRSDQHNSVYRYLKQALTEDRITGLGNGEEIRGYIHVKDVARLSVEILSEKHRNQHVIITGHPMKFIGFLHTIKEILDNKIKVELKAPPSGSVHYNLTPYSFIPKIGYKLTSNCYIDLGQGILECLNEIHSQNRIKTENKAASTDDSE